MIHKKKARHKLGDSINDLERFRNAAKHWLMPYRGMAQKFFLLHEASFNSLLDHQAEDHFPLVLAC